jgi:hypothetical protein
MTSTPLHEVGWQRSASGCAIRTRYRGLHVSVWRPPQGGRLRFTISGGLPPAIATTSEAISFVWRTLLQYLPSRRAA